MSYATDLDATISMMRKRTISLAWLAALTGLLALTSCDSATNAGMGTVRLYLASSGVSTMVAGATAVDFGVVTSAIVTIDSAVLMPGHVAIPLDPAVASFDLVDMDEDVTALLGAVPTLGEYEQLRLFVGSAVVTATLPDGSTRTFEEEALVPSGQQTGIKVNFGGPIEVGLGATVDLIAVFDVAESFVFQGPPDDPRSVSFKPVIHASTMPWPSIAGQVTVPAGVTVSVTVEALIGTDVKSDTTFSVTGPDPVAYKLRFLEAGTTYDVRATATPSTGLVTPAVQSILVDGEETGVDFAFTSSGP